MGRCEYNNLATVTREMRDAVEYTAILQTD